MQIALLIVVGLVVLVSLVLPFWRFSRARPVYHPFTLLLLHKYPTFEDPADYPWVGPLRARFADIRDELLTFVSERQTHGVPSRFTNLQSAPEAWKLIPLTRSDQPDAFTPLAKLHFATTVETLQQIPHAFSVYFSYLEPHTRIAPHRGEADAYVRVHFGMQVPQQLPACGFQVKRDQRSWREGDVLIFNDIHRHTAFNESDQGRFVLMFDVMRPRYADSQAHHMKLKYAMFQASFSLGEAPWYYKPSAYLNKQWSLLRAMTS